MERSLGHRPVSLIVPVRNEEHTINVLLESILNQTRRPDEVIIVDGHSTDRTCAVVEDSIRAGCPVKLVRADRANPGEGRNIGVRAASHETIAFTDAGVRLDSRWLEKLGEPLEQDPSVDVVYGTYEPVLDSFFRECAALAYVPPLVVRNGGRIRGPSVVSSLMKKSVWEAVGGFRPYRAAEDLIFMEEVAKRGLRTAYARDAVAYWQIVPDWCSMFRKFSLYSYHNLLAGRARHWHYGVARLYGAVFVFVGLGAMYTAWSWLILPAAHVARIVKTAFVKRHSFAFRDVFRLKRLLYVGLCLLVLDAATTWGALIWLFKRASGVRWES